MAKKSDKTWIPVVIKRDGTWMSVLKSGVLWKKNKKRPAAKERCRHERNSWIILGGHAEWCYVCGAYRRLRMVGLNSCVPCSKWNIPSGDRKINPVPKEAIK